MFVIGTWDDDESLSYHYNFESDIFKFNFMFYLNTCFFVSLYIFSKD